MSKAAPEIHAKTIPRPTDVAWVLLAIPIEEWPKYQNVVESLQLVAKFTTTVLRPKDETQNAKDG